MDMGVDVVLLFWCFYGYSKKFILDVEIIFKLGYRLMWVYGRVYMD